MACRQHNASGSPGGPERGGQRGAHTLVGRPARRAAGAWLVSRNWLQAAAAMLMLRRERAAGWPWRSGAALLPCTHSASPGVS